jgi:tRNA1(Val) A37 N6-methylase TrmN6
MLADVETTEDAVLGGRLVLRQPKKGHRFGHDAILLAAAVDAHPGEVAVELGAGVGAAALALAHRVPRLDVRMVEIDPALADLARENAARNNLDDRVTVTAMDVAADPREFARSGMTGVHHVFMNPPFNDPVRQKASPDPARRLAHVATDGLIRTWVERAMSLVNAQGTITVIWRAAGLGEVLQALEGFGHICVLPVHPKPDATAIRVIVRAVRGGAGPLALWPPLVLNDADGKASSEAEAILRGSMPLAFGP